MKNNVEATLILDGLLEGHLPPGEEARRKLDDWVRFSGKNRLIFHLEIDGNSFSLLADNRAVDVRPWNSDAAELVSNLLEELLKIFPDAGESQVFSTIRSREYKKNLEIQTLYSIGAGGKIRTESRELATHTREAEKPLSQREKLGLAAIGTLSVLILLLLSGLFIDYKTLFSRIKAGITPIDTSQVPVDNTFAGYFSVTGLEKENSTHLILTLVKGELYPVDTPALEDAWSRVVTLHQQLVLQSLARGYIHYEYYTTDNNVFLRKELRIADLASGEELKLLLPYTNESKPARIVLTYY